MCDELYTADALRRAKRPGGAINCVDHGGTGSADRQFPWS
jgi:hypothetical protein